MTQTSLACHPWSVSRRAALRAGALGLGLDLGRLRAWSGETASSRKATSCIYIFLSGGLAQHESFDLKPAAPAGA
jgi:uncharacterized protein (DUF1501 family)